MKLIPFKYVNDLIKIIQIEENMEKKFEELR